MTVDWINNATAGNTPSAVEVPTGGPSAAAPNVAEAFEVPADLLDGGEIVILAVKPSLWTVVFSSFQWLLGGAVILCFMAWAGPLSGWVSAASLIQVVLAVVGLRLGLAIMQWVSRVYVLTNRRVMRIRGVFKADVFACPLVKIINSGVTAGPHEAATRLGTIWFNTDTAPNEARGSWYHVAKPYEVHAQIRRAIERAIDSHS
ncbi:MAG: PH domain-containing protein [bacterium]|nr:PH domain-containing protein [bacterium]